MKKYLINGLLALFVGGFAASCADKDVDYVPLDQQKATAYADAFKELIGGEVAPNHDWGFTKTSLIDETAETRAKTRGGSEPNQTVWPDYGYPDKPGQLKATTPSGKSEEQIVTEWFQSHTIDDAVTLDCNNYWVLQVHYKDYNYTAQQHEWEKYENGQEVWKTGTEALSPLHHMDQIYANRDANSTSYDHIYNFNTGTGDFMLVRDSETKYGFGYEESWGTSDKHVYNRSFMAHIVDEANGIDGYYVGFDYQAYKDKDVSYQYWDGTQTISGTTTNWALNPDGVYDDRIIKIVPGTAAREIGGGSSSSTSTSTRTDRIERRQLVAQGRIFCEDLGTTTVTTSDIDFNDAVFDAKIWKLCQLDFYYTNNDLSGWSKVPLEGVYTNGLENGKYKYIAEICLLAAGGTVPLKIGGNNGFEIHSKFGQKQNPSRTIGHTTIINTMGQPSQANFSTTVNTDVCKAVTEEVDITSYVDSVFVNYPNNPEIGLDIIPIDVQWVSANHESVGELSADFGKVPQKLCVPIGTRWVYERIPITPPSEGGLGAYIDFASYARTGSPLFWNGSKNESLLYPSDPEGLIAETNVTNNVNTNPYHDKVITTGPTITTTVDRVDLWLKSDERGEFGASTQGFKAHLFSMNIQEGDVIRVYGTNTGSDSHYLEVALVPKEPNAEWGSRLYDANVDFSNGYVDIRVSKEIADQLPTVSQYFGLWGTNITVTKIERIRTTVK